jgi:hypothetical protein
MCGESGRSIRAVMGFDVVLRPSMGRVGIAKDGLYLRSRFRLRNHQMAIDRTEVQRYSIDEAGPISALVYQSRPPSTIEGISIHYLWRRPGALKSLLERL